MTTNRSRSPNELVDAGKSVLIDGSSFIEQYLGRSNRERQTMRDEGANLAARIRTKAIDLCHNRATEFSPEIGRLFETAAKVALLAHWPDEEALAQYEKDVSGVFRASKRSDQHATNYLAFKRDYVENRHSL